MATIGKLVVAIIGRSDALDKDLKRTEKKIDGWNKRVGKKFGGMFDMLGKVGLAALGGGAIVGGLKKFADFIHKSAENMDQLREKVGAVDADKIKRASDAMKRLEETIDKIILSLAAGLAPYLSKFATALDVLVNGNPEANYPTLGPAEILQNMRKADERAGKVAKENEFLSKIGIGDTLKMEWGARGPQYMQQVEKVIVSEVTASIQKKKVWEAISAEMADGLIEAAAQRFDRTEWAQDVIKASLELGREMEKKRIKAGMRAQLENLLPQGRLQILGPIRELLTVAGLKNAVYRNERAGISGRLNEMATAASGRSFGTVDLNRTVFNGLRSTGGLDIQAQQLDTQKKILAEQIKANGGAGGGRPVIVLQ